MWQGVINFMSLSLSRSKFQIATSLNFAGCVVPSNGVQPDPSRISSLTDFPVPHDQTGVRSFLGLCNQFAFFIPDYQQHTVALRQLTGKGRSFLWLPEHQVEFDKLTAILTSDTIVRHFDSTKDAVLLTDASRLLGLGYALGHVLLPLWKRCCLICRGLSSSASSATHTLNLSKPFRR